ncbi:MAG: 3-deoxy-manno-octulosonate cytidylyltransferase [Planctomycetes bacterium]|nr:3-deoxy-manno-octulosonate cytidylyltransferase [Planctomycetota bacterium]
MVVAIIPARFASQRLPAKMLLAKTGKPLVAHTVAAVLKAKSVNRVIVATDHIGILKAARDAGAEAFMTSPDHASGTDRIAEVVDLHVTDDVILNVQGDEPRISPAALDLLVAAFTTPGNRFPMGTLASEMTDPEALANPNVVKAVVAPDGRALYFTRAPAPFHRAGNTEGRFLKHAGIYIFRREFLLSYPRLPRTPLEEIEKLEQLRALEHGYDIQVIITRHDAPGVDTEADYERFVETETRAHPARRAGGK